MNVRALLLLVGLVGCNATSVDPYGAPATPTGDTCKDTLTLLGTRCTVCHRAEGQVPSLEAEAVAAVVDSVIVSAGSAEESKLYQLVSMGSMPPGAPLAADEIELVRAWIDGGASADCEAPNVTAKRHHPDGWADPAMHGLELKLAGQNCKDCHGEDLTGRLGPSCDSCHRDGWRTECTYCHGGTVDMTGAPPRDLTGVIADLSFDAHTAHVSESNHAPFACTECHVEPTEATSPGHFLDRTPARAEVDFSGGRSAGGQYAGDASCTNLYCHGNGQTPGSWSVAQGRPGCSDCHLGPNAGRWRTMSGAHDRHLRENLACTECHAGTVDRQNQIVGLDLHVNGTPDVVVTEIPRNGDTCNGLCHGEDHANRGWFED